VNQRSDYWLSQLGWSALVGFGFSIWQVWNLRQGNLAVDLADSGAILAGHVVVAWLLVLPALAVCQLVRESPPTLPAFWTLFCLVFVELRLRVLPALLTLTTLLVGAALLLSTLLLAFLWSRRPWGGRLDRVLAVLLLAALPVILWWPRDRGVALAAAEDRVDLEVSDLAVKPDIYLILIDTLRADHLGLYGYPLPTSPALDRLASKAVVFDRAYSASNWTRPAVASLLTSTVPSVHNVIQLDRAVPAELPLVTEALKLGGYSTAIFSSGGNLEPQDGYSRGVDHFFSREPLSALERTPIGGKILARAIRRLRARLDKGSRGQLPPSHLSDQATAWVRGAPRSRPVFVYLHLPGPHAPYLPPKQFASVFSDQEPLARLSEPPRRKWSGEDWLSEADRRQMIAQYDGEILQHDVVVEEFLDSVVHMSRPRSSYFIVTADHGEGFGEHGVWGHAVGLFNEITRVPLIVARSPVAPNPGRRAVPASLLDLAPTLCELAGIKPLDSFQGVSLAPWLEEDVASTKEVIVENPLYDEEGLVTPEWVFFRGRRGIAGEEMGDWLYGTEDISQANDLTPTEHELSRHLNLFLDHWLQALRERRYESDQITLEQERIERLRTLGYID